MKLLFSFIFISLTSLPGICMPDEIRIIPIDSLQSLIQNENKAESKINIHLNFASLLFCQDPDIALKNINEAEALAHENNLSEKLAQIYIARGEFYKKQGDYTSAIDQYLRALRFNENHSSPHVNKGWPYTSIGNFLYDLGQFSQAMEYYRSALLIFDQQNQPYGKAVAYNNIGICMLELGFKKAALHNFKKGLNERLKLNIPQFTAHSYYYLSRTYEGKKRDSVVLYANKILSGIEKGELQSEILKIAANENIRIGKFEKAEEFLLTAFEVNDNDKEYHRNVGIYLLFGKMYRAAGNLPLAEEYFNKGLKISKNCKLASQNVNLLSELKLVYEDANDHLNTLKIANQLIELNDSLNLVRNAILMKVIHFQTNLDKAEIENQKLNSQYAANLEKMERKEIYFWIAVILGSVFLFLLINIYRLKRKNKRSEKTNRESHRRMFAIISNTSNIIVSVQKDGTIRIINKAAEDFFYQLAGIKVQIGHNLLKSFSKPSHIKVWSDWLKKAETMESWQEVNKVNLLGEDHYLYKNFSALYDDKGNFDGLVMVGADFSENRKQEMEIERSRDELNRANEAKEKMISILAHDLKDTVYSTKSLADMINENPSRHNREDLLEYFRILAKNFAHTSELLEGILGWLKTQTEGLIINREDINILSLSKEVIYGMEDKIESKKLEINFEFNDNLWVTADREMIKTVLRNLISNAIKFTAEQKGKITISNKDKGKYSRITVRDNGIGMDTADIKNILEMPGHISRTGTRNEEGSGLGLSLCRGLLKLHHTDVIISSKPDGGSSFSFDLPKMEELIPS